jgi:hypothetical protein
MYKIIRWFSAFVWIANGLFCKVLNLVPRHEEIVARILGTDHARPFTIAIGSAEILMAVWIITGIKSRMNVITQILVIGTMNALEFFLAPDLLLWGRTNALFAFLFMGLLFFNEFYLHQRSRQKR